METDNRYSFSVIWSDEDKSYVATCPEFPGLSAFGDDPITALTEARTVLESFLNVYAEDGIDLPTARRVKEYSGQLRVRMPKSLHARLVGQAELDGVSLNMIIVSYLSASSGIETLVLD